MRIPNLPALSVSPVASVVAGAERFARMRGQNHRDAFDYSRVVVDPDAVRKIGTAYNDLPFMDNEARSAWKAFANETRRQFDFLTAPESRGGMGITVTVEMADPYDTSAEGGTRLFFDDVANGRMRVMSTRVTGSHFLLTDDENDMFRAVHDVFGHCGTGRGVDRHGEEAAFRKHSLMYSRTAQKALATETRGQNHAMILAGGVFPDQKISVLPAWARDFRTASPSTVAGYRAAFKQAEEFHARQGL